MFYKKNNSSEQSDFDEVFILSNMLILTNTPYVRFSYTNFW